MPTQIVTLKAVTYRRGIEAHFLGHLHDKVVAALYAVFCRVRVLIF